MSVTAADPQGKIQTITIEKAAWKKLKKEIQNVMSVSADKRELKIVLTRAPDDPPRDDPAYQQELSTFSKALHDKGVKYSTRGMTFDSVEGGGFALGEYVVQFGPEVLTVLAAACAAWLHGRSGRKVWTKIGDVEAEANSLQELDALLKRAAHFERALRGTITKEDEWVTAAEATRLLEPVFNSEYMAQMTICKRAHSGLIRSRAQRFIMDNETRDNFEIPKGFWWAEGNAALDQNWTTGDFDTWIDRDEVHLQAFGVSFLRADIEKMIPAAKPEAPAVATSPAATGVPKGGRPKADWWEDLWIEICRQLYVGDLKPKTQADIERAMHQWISDHDNKAGDTTVRDRASRLWRAIDKDEN